MNNSDLFIIPKPIENPRVRMFCFPFAGGSASAFVNWPKFFDDTVELVLVQLPGRGSRMMDSAHDNMEDVVKELMLEAEYLTSCPYVFFGHSLGSRIAFELSCRLKNEGMRLAECLIASGSRAAHIAYENTDIYKLPDDEFVEELRELNGTPKEVLENAELMKFLLPLLRADFKIADSHLSEVIAMPFPIVSLHGEDDSGTSVEVVQEWKKHTSVDYKLVLLPGGHFFINQHQDEAIAQIKLVVNQVLDSLPRASESSFSDTSNAIHKFQL